jgi:acyl-CoA thioester hydrolase
MKAVETSFSVRYAETDQMGIVYHANYYVWFEVGRTEFFKSIDLPYWEIEKQGLYLPVLESFCKYRHSARFGDTVIVKTRVKDVRPTRLKLTYEVFRKQDGVLLAEGYTEHTFINKDGKPLNIKKSHPRIWEVLEKLTVTKFSSTP